LDPLRLAAAGAWAVAPRMAWLTVKPPFLSDG
jgi:hypothetical protein